MAKTKILFVTHEMSPFLELSKISEITRQLPQAMQEKGFEIRILMPRFGNINERRNRLHEVIRLSGMNIVVDNNDNPLIIKVASLPAARMQVYFLDNEDYFQRKKVFKNESGEFFDDNNERSVFFCKGVLETVKKLGWSPDVVHCHGWFSALVPAYLKTTYKDDPAFKGAKVMYSLYNEDDFGSSSLHAKYAEIAPEGSMTAEDAANYGSGSYVDVYKGALAFTDVAVIADQGVSQEIIDFAKSRDIQIFEPHGDEDYEAFNDLFDQFAPVEEETTV
ncbi:starch synthase catalytic domain protein [Sphingobacterium spiritivorum ATCC 33300]|uniref:starch synthase n=1 Tax=Sphingobacterium spiritivorum ATCC 33300 TaxID=525372 RepID=C2FWU6_SPHSI|nr:glycogen/starch synthase [Sphingobacterium spiritivorum]EEI92575.1 starch synthase catalytic domain protein [Sphingobacterium spiritivorum ATCC 33300]QQS94099.1 glycogen/starch synthase [Sphingobacterium spiritivorum]